MPWWLYSGRWGRSGHPPLALPVLAALSPALPRRPPLLYADNSTFPFWVDEPGGELTCPMHAFRVSNDVKANWGSIISNAMATLPYADAEHPMSSPGCWAYPDSKRAHP